MGLSLRINLLKDRELAKDAVQDSRRINELLAQRGLPEHHEPLTIDSSIASKFHFGPYRALVPIRRLAATIALEEKLPQPIWSKFPPKDRDFMDQFVGNQLLRDKPVLRWFTRQLPYAHLIMHSDSDGYYTPLDFKRLIFVEDQSIAGPTLGSSFSLQRECADIAQRIKLPLETDPYSKEFDALVASDDAKKPLWSRYGNEAYACLVLHKAATASIDAKSILAFG